MTIRFKEDTHQYLADEGELISVSAFTERFKQKVNWKAIAKKVATKKTKEGTPTTTQDILNKWDRKRDLSAGIGTIYHAHREKELLNQTLPVFYNTPCNMVGCSYNGGEKYSMPINTLTNNSVYPELMIYDTDYMVCGQADKVIITKNTINIWDYKTDAEIKFKAFSSKWVSPQKFLPPISHLDDCNGNMYSLKMSLYMYLLWKANKGRLKPGEIIIEHVHLKRDPDNDNIPYLLDGYPLVEKIERISLPYRKKEVMDMLETLKVKV